MHPPRQLNHIRAALYGEPWMISDNGLEQIIAIAESHAAGQLPEAAAMYGKEEKPKSSLLEMVNGHAVVSIQGPVFPKANMLTRMSGATSSQQIGEALDEAVAAKPRSIIMRIDSPGGAVQGGFEVADKLNEIRESGLPLVAHVDGMAASLAYLFASQADVITMSKYSQVGSVSVIYRSMNDERAMRNAGVDAITLRSGDRKQVDTILAAGNSTTAQMASVVRRVDKLHGMFVAAVKRSRKHMDEAKFATGEMWHGDDAITSGMADEMLSFEQLVSAL